MVTAICLAGWQVRQLQVGAFNYNSLLKVFKALADMLGHAPKTWCTGVATCWDTA